MLTDKDLEMLRLERHHDYVAEAHRARAAAELFDSAVELAQAVRYWRNAAKRDLTEISWHGFSPRQCLHRAGVAKGKIVNLSIRAEKMAEREARL